MILSNLFLLDNLLLKLNFCKAIMQYQLLANIQETSGFDIIELPWLAEIMGHSLHLIRLILPLTARVVIPLYLYVYYKYQHYTSTHV